MAEKPKKLGEHKTKLKRGDMVTVITGKDLGKEGKVLMVDRKKNRLVVEGINMMTRHQKPSRTNQTGGIIQKEAPVHVSNVMYLHKDKPTRLGYKVEVNVIDGKREVMKKRYAKSTGDIID
jgi:large subunit ribosomal protein L24